MHGYTFFEVLSIYTQMVTKEWIIAVWIFFSIFLIVNSWKYKKKYITGRTAVAATLIPTYLFFIIVLTVFSRSGLEVGQPRIQILPLWSYLVGVRQSAYIWIDIKYNILLFVPFGFLLHIYYKKGKEVIIIACSCSLVVELLQLVFSKGTFETDGLLHNTLVNGR